MNPYVPGEIEGGLILASRSPRRVDILKGLGFDFEVHPAPERIEDGVTGRDPYSVPRELARRKCAAVAKDFPDALVLAADTVVVLDDEILTKPADDDEAVRFIERLAGRTHTVVTGVALERASRNRSVSGDERTRVTFRELDPSTIEQYVSTGEGRDKAGSYAAQGIGAGLIRRIDGCFYNVVGLPIALLLDLLGEI